MWRIEERRRVDKQLAAVSRDILKRYVVIPILCRGPLAPLRPTDPRDLLMSESDWSSHLSSHAPYSGALRQLSYIPDEDGIPFPGEIVQGDTDRPS